jgi:uncharacterized protein (TIGR03083 family)
VDFAQHLVALRRDGAAYEGAVRAAGVDAPVPSCPGWTVADLLEHLGRIHRWVASIVSQRDTQPPAFWDQVDVPARAELVDWSAAGWRALADALAATGPDVEVWSWTPWRTTAFWARRQAHELAVHRFDAQLAAGASPDPVPADQAVDAVDELLELFPHRRRRPAISGAGETIHLHATDAAGEWLLRLVPEGIEVTREHAKGDVAARGPASDLLLFLFGRVAPTRLEVFGDASLLERWQRDAGW